MTSSPASAALPPDPAATGPVPPLDTGPVPIAGLSGGTVPPFPPQNDSAPSPLDQFLTPQHPPPSAPLHVYPRPLTTHEALLSDRVLFLDTLARFHAQMGGALRIPQMGGRELDLHLLYSEVTRRGGLHQVIADRKWRDVTLPFDFPPTTTSASYVLRKFYINLLHHFEQTYMFRREGALVPPPPLTPFPRKRGKRKQKPEQLPPRNPTD